MDATFHDLRTKRRNRAWLSNKRPKMLEDVKHIISSGTGKSQQRGDKINQQVNTSC